MGGLGATGGSGLPRPAGLRASAGRLPAEEQGRRVAAVVVRTCFVAPGNGRTRG